MSWRGFSLVPLAVIMLLPGCSGVPPVQSDSCSTTSSDGPATVSYTADIIPLFTAGGCLSSACHSGPFPSSGYDLRTHATGFQSGDVARRISMCAIVPGDPENSFLIEKLRSDDPVGGGYRMPMEREPLTEEEITMIETWIREGAQNN